MTKPNALDPSKTDSDHIKKKYLKIQQSFNEKMDTDIQILLKNYNKWIKKRRATEDEQLLTLQLGSNDLLFKFDNLNEAKDFFLDVLSSNPQAEFIMVETIDGIPQNNGFVSCGTGKLYSGSMNSIKNEIEQDLKLAVDDSTKQKLQKYLNRIRVQSSHHFKQNIQGLNVAKLTTSPDIENPMSLN